MQSQHLRGDVTNSVRDMVVRQDLRPGRSVGEVALARRLGVSRTPVREALLTLEREGLMMSSRGRGFEVSRLTSSEVAEIYPVIWTLERLALEMAGPPSAELIFRLQQVNGELDRSNRTEERVRLDTQWHDLLVSECANDHLMRVICDLKQIVRRYEFAYLEDGGRKAKSTAEHARIIRLLQDDRAAALDLLTQHWRDGMEQVIKFLGDQEASNEQ